MANPPNSRLNIILVIESLIPEHFGHTKSFQSNHTVEEHDKNNRPINKRGGESVYKRNSNNNR